MNDSKFFKFKNEIMKKLEPSFETKTTEELMEDIKNLAHKSLKEKQYKAFSIKLFDDSRLGLDLDGETHTVIFINGHSYFPKDLEERKYDVLNSYFNYFTDKDLKAMSKNI